MLDELLPLAFQFLFQPHWPQYQVRWTPVGEYALQGHHSHEHSEHQPSGYGDPLGYCRGNQDQNASE